MNSIRAHSMAEVAEITGWPKRSIEDDCRAGRVEHIRRYGKRWMTDAQIEAMVRQSTRRVVNPQVTTLTADDRDRIHAARRSGRAA